LNPISIKVRQLRKNLETLPTTPPKRPVTPTEHPATATDSYTCRLELRRDLHTLPTTTTSQTSQSHRALGYCYRPGLHKQTGAKEGPAHTPNHNNQSHKSVPQSTRLLLQTATQAGPGLCLTHTRSTHLTTSACNTSPRQGSHMQGSRDRYYGRYSATTQRLTLPSQAKGAWSHTDGYASNVCMIHTTPHHTTPHHTTSHHTDQPCTNIQSLIHGNTARWPHR
jgi:hypothetical protein